MNIRRENRIARERKLCPELWDRRVDAEDYSVSTVQNPPFISIRVERGNEHLMETGHE